MTRLFRALFLAWTAAGAVLLFVPFRTQAWWSPVWIMLLAVTAYVRLAGYSGLVAARLAAGISIAGFGAVLALAVAGLPTGTIRFTAFAGPMVAGLPVLLPLFAFGLLALSWDAACCTLPHARRNAVAFATGGVLGMTMAIGGVFLALRQSWWMTPAPGSTSFWLSLLCLAAAAAGLSTAFPAGSLSDRSRRRASLTDLAAMNGLFLLALATQMLGAK